MKVRKSYYVEVVVEKSAVFFAFNPRRRPMVQLSSHPLATDGIMCFILREFYSIDRHDDILNRNEEAPEESRGLENHG